MYITRFYSGSEPIDEQCDLFEQERTEREDEFEPVNRRSLVR
jgi:hypothetical protein